MNRSKTALLEQLHELKTELASLRVQKIAGGSASKITKINSTRKAIAKVLTVVSHKQRQNVREMYKKKNTKFLPLDLRYKKTRLVLASFSFSSLHSILSIFVTSQLTNPNHSPLIFFSLFLTVLTYLQLRSQLCRAIRRKLSKHELAQKTEKAHKKEIHFPLRKFALKA